MLRKLMCVMIVCSFALVTAQQNAELQSLMQPGANHLKLNSLVGFWEANCSVFNGQGEKVYEESGFCENKWILGNRFIILEHMFTSFHTAAVLGYDNFLQSYTAAHIDSESSSIHHFIGSVNEGQGKKMFILRGESPGFDGELVSTVYVIEVLSNDRYKLKVHYEIEEMNLKVFEIDFSRLEEGVLAKAQKQIGLSVANSFARKAMTNSKLQALNPLVGQWRIESLIFDDAGNVLRVDEGMSQNRWIMMRKFVMMTSKMGQYESIAIVGFDQAKEVYVAAHADNIGTSIYHSEGGRKNKAFKLFGTAMDYATGEKTELTQTITINNANSHSCEMYRERDKVGLGVSTMKMDAKRINK